MPEEATLLHELFAAAARQHPEGAAIEVPPQRAGAARVSVSYRELGRRAERVAAAVAPHASADAVIAVLLPRQDPQLYAAQLGILQAGAAFTCLDPRFPDAHLREVVAEAAAVVSDAAGRRRLAGLGVELPPVVEAAGAEGAAPAAARARERDLAYVIYTSGTTGKPKGVMIEHRSIVNLARANMAYFGLGAEARVAQCSSPAYDSSLEETWLALAVGATLVLLDDATIRLGPDLVPWLRRERIQVFCPPPTLLRATGCEHPERELPELKLLYVGGEALPQDLAERWARGRWLENGYGPTECTVTSVRTRVRPGEAVAIGRAVEGCQAWVLDEAGAEVAAGEAGELCLGGRCLGRGYRHQEALTRQKFPLHPRLGRIYRSGDRVRQRADGKLEYLGRLDAQVKLRGYRIELEAVETALAGCAGVRAAACRLQGEALVAHIVPHGAPPAAEALREALRRQLPEYMVPSRIGYLAELPTTTGGKLDRERLPELTGAVAGGAGVEPRNPGERAVAEAFAAALGRAGPVSVADDFFLELGGDSLTAVDCIVRLRAQGWTATVRELYEARTAAGLAAAARREAAPAAAAARPHGEGRPGWCTAAQAGWIAAELVAASALGYGGLFVALPWLLARLPLWQALAALLGLALAGLVAYAPLSVLATAGLKRALIGRYRAGKAPVWSGFYLRHWMVTQAARAIPWGWLQGTAAQAWALRRLGARVGTRVYLHRGVDLSHGGWDLLWLGDGATVGQDAALRLVDLDGGQLEIGAVRVGAGATLDTRAGMDPGTELGREAYLGPLSWLPEGTTVPAGERWDGTPAALTGAAPMAPVLTGAAPMAPVLTGAAPAAPALTGAAPAAPAWTGAAPGAPAWTGDLPMGVHCALVLAGRGASLLVAGLPWLLLAAWTPAGESARAVAWLDAPTFGWAGVAMAAGLAAAAVVGTLALRAAWARWLGGGLGRRAPLVASQWSLAAIRIEATAAQVESAGRWLSGTLFWPLWLRAAGMRIGRGCEISTILDVLPATVEIGAESFFADGIYLGGPRRHRGTLAVERTRLGGGTFLGNHAVIPCGHDWPEGLFVGIATVPEARRARPHTAWFGQPPMELPRKAEAVDRRYTHDPGPVRYATRLFWELARLALPALPLLLAAGWEAALGSAAGSWGDAGLALVVAPLLTAAAAAAGGLAIVALKWVLLGRVRPGQRYFWSCWCGRWDFLYMAWQYWGPAVLAPLEGTLLLNQFLRLTGMRIGRRVALGPGFLQVVDPDLLRFDDDATVNCHLQAHTFEDRVLKMDRIHVGRGATVGDEAVVLYAVEIGAEARVAPHSVVMKHEVVPAGARFNGAPALPEEAPQALTALMA